MASDKIFELNTRISSSNLSGELKEVLAVFTELFGAAFAEKEREVADLKTKITSLEEKVSVMESEADIRAQQERANKLIISGNLPIEKPGENCINIVLGKIRQHTNLNLNENDIKNAYRIGMKKSQGSKRNIIFEVTRSDLVGEIFSACKQFKDMQIPPFFINSSLTPYRNKIFYILRQAKKKSPQIIETVRPSYGKIVVFFKKDTARSGLRNRPDNRTSNRVVIYTKKALENFVSHELNLSIEDFQVVW